MSSSFLLVSPRTLRLRSERLHVIVNEEMPVNRQRVNAARELGDLSENAEYQVARREEAQLREERSRLSEDISNAHLIVLPRGKLLAETNDVLEFTDDGEAQRVLVMESAAAVNAYREPFLMFGEPCPEKNIAGIDAVPALSALLGHAEGESVLLGERRLTLERIHPSPAIGRSVTLRYPNGDHTYHILGAWDTDEERGVISYRSPLAQALRASPLCVGDIVEVPKRGALGKTLEVELVAVAPIPDEILDWAEIDAPKE